MFMSRLDGVGLAPRAPLATHHLVGEPRWAAQSKLVEVELATNAYAQLAADGAALLGVFRSGFSVSPEGHALLSSPLLRRRKLAGDLSTRKWPPRGGVQ